MRFKKTTVVVAAVAAPMLLVVPGVFASGDGSMSEQLAAYERAHAGNADVSEMSPARGENGVSPDDFAPCVRGVAQGTDYTCDGVQLLGRVPLAEMGLSYGNDIWGWTAPDGKREWAIMGGDNGTAFVEVTDPMRPVVTGMLPRVTSSPRFIWRDMKVVNDHAYIVSEDADSGMQIFDLSRLLDAAPGTTFDDDGVFDGTSTTHNIVANEATDTVYLVGSNVCAGGLYAVDVSEPKAPAFAGCFSDHGYFHDAQCVIYEGPDAEHHGKNICLGAVSNFDGAPFIRTELSIVDMTDPANPVPLSLLEYNDGGFGYSHQGWLNDDQSIWVHGDELDEFDAFGGLVNTNTSSWIFDVSDLDAPAVIEQVFHETTAIDHNLYFDDGVIYATNYAAGLRVFSADGLADGEMEQVAYFDTWPADDLGLFDNGTWGNYPFFEQENLVAVSDQGGGLFLLRVHTP